MSDCFNNEDSYKLQILTNRLNAFEYYFRPENNLVVEQEKGNCFLFIRYKLKLIEIISFVDTITQIYLLYNKEDVTTDDMPFQIIGLTKMKEMFNEMEINLSEQLFSDMTIQRNRNVLDKKIVSYLPLDRDTCYFFSPLYDDTLTIQENNKLCPGNYSFSGISAFDCMNGCFISKDLYKDMKDRGDYSGDAYSYAMLQISKWRKSFMNKKKKEDANTRLRLLKKRKV